MKVLSVAVAGGMDLESCAIEDGSSRTSCSLESRLALRLRRELSGLQRRRRSLMVSTAVAGQGRWGFYAVAVMGVYVLSLHQITGQLCRQDMGFCGCGCRDAMLK